MTGAEIRDTLVGIVPESRWAAWWATARKHPQVVASSSGRQSYRWEASQAGALAALRRSYARADPRARLELLRKNAERDPQLGREMAGDLASLAVERAEQEPGLAFEIWFALERSGHLPESLADLPGRLTGPGADLRRLLAGIEDRLLRERALVMARERRPDWPSAYKDQATREEDSRVLDLLFEGLRAADAGAADRLLDDLIAQPRRAPAAFAWLAERAATDEALRARAPLRLLQQILSALGDPTFARFRVRLRALCETGGTVPRLFAHLEPSQAAGAVEALRRAGALENYERDPLVAALEMRFPALRESDSPTGGPLYATSEAIEAKRSELKRLTEVDIPANRKAIAEARAMGDLRENFEYKAARERHEYLNARLAAMHRELGRARPIDFGSLDTSEVRVGTRVRLASPGGEPRRIAILGPWESQPEQGVLSYESELAKSLLGLKAGDSVEIGGERLRVEAIEPAL
jgi:transcription elongation GreA/GreB family factor